MAPTEPSNSAERDLPQDPDIEVVEASGKTLLPLHLRPASLVFVFVGGALGTAAREGVSLALPSGGEVPWAIFAVNILGALLLGLLLEALTRRGPDAGARRAARLLVGTGFMGGFTTYSALAADSAALLTTGHATTAIGYAVGTVLIGAAATGLGILLGSARHRQQQTRTEGVK
ncbi:CrcB protein [Microbacterium endophyticum]|uniref:Fluoride-specific ion channel FluC n=1 Tax=Microbacterium endophyticum TaxID=1526412 RepID=A0A7W4V0R8_9MICO|nr:CrcB family protein [Microbacterium endophyticum]MBB2974712.1 CrcB protein [Microbacterium endophyticum]NIK37009.1 CrcB protein [Microbacterium endophyticum]